MIIRVIDFETTGLPPAPCRPVELAYVDLQGGGHEWKRGRMWQTLINPGVMIDVEAMAVHHITDADVAAAPSFEMAIHKVMEGGPEAFAAHNAAFERSIWPSDHVPWICTYKAAVLSWPDAPSFKNQVLRYWLGLNLADASLAQPHRALGDAYVTAAILRRLLTQQHGRPWTVDELIEATAGPVLLPRFHFGEHARKPLAEVPTSYLEWMVHKAQGGWEPDVLHTARHHLTAREIASRARSPVALAAEDGEAG